MVRKTKTPTHASPLDAVAGLIEERAKYERWLEDLEGKRSSTPQKVYDRVHSDYLSRLQGVMDQLKSHTDSLKSHAAALNKRLIELASAEESRLEERAEAELRSNVGEMTPAEWDLASKKADKELAKLKQDQELIETDLDRIQGILDELAGGTPARASGAAPTPKVDEMEFLKSVVGTGPRPAVMPPPPPPKAQEPSVPEARAAVPSAAPAAPATPAATPAAPTPPAGAPVAPPPPQPAAKPTPTTGSIEVPKTLKCQECGTMNYPSEWYCEKCGAELTVV